MKEGSQYMNSYCESCRLMNDIFSVPLNTKCVFILWQAVCLLIVYSTTCRLCGYEPFYSDNVSEMFNKILKCDYVYDSPWWDDVSENAKVRLYLY